MGSWMRYAMTMATLLFGSVTGFTPYEPTPGWQYHVEAYHPTEPWPACQARFMSFPGSCDSVDLWSGVGENQQFEFQALIAAAHDGSNSSTNASTNVSTKLGANVSAPAFGSYRIRLACGQYLSYSETCGNTALTTSPTGAATFRLTQDGGPQGDSFAWSIEAEGRSASGCTETQLSFPGASPGSSCNGAAPQQVSLAPPSEAPLWLLQVASGPDPENGGLVHVTNTEDACADPFIWTDSSAIDPLFWLVCSHGRLPFSSLSESLSQASVFETDGSALPTGTLPPWASGNNRWAPETGVAQDGASVLFFSDSQPTGPRRVGWSWAESGPGVGAYDLHAATAMDLGQSPAGEIDQHVYHDDDGRTYFLWKTDDNSPEGGNALVTRLWAQEMVMAGESVTMVGEPVVVMDSTGLWWVDSWIAGGSLVEGPQVVKRDGVYYLFFASGRYCEDSYKEGVARSDSIFGPYEKMPVPLLSTEIVGWAPSPIDGTLSKLIGPGHGSFVQDQSGELWQMYHASHGTTGNSCQRYGFLDPIVWGTDGWPRMAF